MANIKTFARYMYTECKTELSFEAWYKKNLATLKSLYNDYLNDTKRK
jgi:hypothetical protein